MRRVIAACLCVLGGCVVGFVLSALVSHGPVEPVAESPIHSALQIEADPSLVSTVADPGHRVIQLLKAPNSLARDAELSDVLAQMKKEDFVASAEELLAWIKGHGGNRLSEALLDAWFQKDSLSARKAAKQAVSDPKNDGPQSAGSLFGAAAARHDPAWAAEHLFTDHDSDTPGWHPNAAIMDEVIKKDRKLADAIMQKFHDSAGRQSLLAGYVSGLSESDPLAAMDLAVSEKTFQRLNLVASAIRAAARTGVNAAKLALSKIDDPSLRRRSAWTAAGIITSETMADPFTILQEEAGLNDPSGKSLSQYTVSYAMSGLVERDPVAAANWVMSLPEENQRTLMASVLNAWSSRDPDAMLQWVAEQESRDIAASGKTGASASSRQLATNLGKLFSAQALLKQGQTREALSAAPQEINEMLSSQLQDFVGNASQDDPEAAADWVARLPSGTTRDRLVSTVAEHYATEEPEAAAKWIEKLPEGLSRDSAIMGLLRVFSSEDPAAASEWVLRISDPAKKEEGVGQVWRAWFGKDREAAREWLASLTGISERLKQKLLMP